MIKKNLQHIDEVRFLIIHLILVNHAMLSYALIRGEVDQILVGFWFEFTSPILALISGYLFFYGTSSHFDFLDKIRHRIPSLVVPYVIWSLGFFIIFCLFRFVIGNLFHLNYWYESLKPLNYRYAWYALKYPSLANFWYLQNLILILPFNLLFYYLLKNKAVSLLFFIVILFIFAYNPFSIYFSPRFLPYYFMGCFFGYHQIYLPKFHSLLRFSKLHINLSLSLIWIPLILFIGVGTGSMEYNGILFVVTKIVVVLFVVICIYNLLDANPDGRIIRYLSKYKPYSFFLFAIHTFIYTLQRPIFKLFEHQFDNKYFTLGFTLFSAMLTLVISLSLGIWINKKWPGFFGIITGR